MFYSDSSKASLFVVVFLLLGVLDVSDASIRVVDLGVEYLSRPDKYVGLQMKAGIEYGARLQKVPRDRDAHLCGTAGFNVTVPDDGRPVALLAKKGVCSYAQKAEFASRNIHPLGIVKVLIIDGETRIMDQQNGKHKTYLEKSYLEKMPTIRSDELPPLSSYEFPSYYNFGNNSNSVVTLRRKHADDISVVLLHVSYETEAELLELVDDEEASVKKGGGTHVTVDTTAPPINQAIIMIWTALCVVLSFVACCCLANAMEDFYEAQQPEPEPPRRPRRNRLTLEQVKKMPIGIFDGRKLVYADEESAIEQEENEHNPSMLFLQPPESSLQDACTICLDEYEVGDKLRCLPCGHAFHANCIAKWLIERSATCPLCNKDFYEEEEESDDEEEEEGELIDETVLPETPSTEDATTEATVEATSSREPWWRNIFRRTERREEFGEGLAEPLLQDQEEQPEHASPDAPSASVDEEAPVSAESNEAQINQDGEISGESSSSN